MSVTPGPTVKYSADDLQCAAEALVGTRPDTIVVYRLWRDVLRLPPDNVNLQILRQIVYRNWRVRQLEEAQLPDGSWGRFHSQDSQAKASFRTTEDAIQRALALGLDLDLGDPVMERVRRYILEALAGQVALRDPAEKNERWPLFVQLMLAGRLAQIDPANAVLEPHRQYWIEVARRAFASGSYRLQDEAAAYPALSGITAPQGFLESQYTLWLLASRPLPDDLDRSLVQWIWNKPDGIRYIRVSLQAPPVHQIGLWFRSLTILSRFKSWGEAAAEALNDLWEQRNEQRLWDFGGEVVKSAEFPLSDNWRRPGSRQADHSTWALVLLRESIRE